VQELKVSTTNSRLCLQAWIFLACGVCQTVAWPAQTFWEGQTFEFTWGTAFCLGCRLSKR